MFLSRNDPPYNQCGTLPQDLYLGGDIRLNFFLKSRTTEYIGKTWHKVHKRNTNARRWKTHTRLIKQLHEQQDDERNQRTLGMDAPEHEQGPINGQYDDEWTEHHDNEKCTTKKICGPHPTNMLQMQTRRTLRQRLSTNYRPEAGRDEDGKNASLPQVNDDNRTSQVQETRPRRRRETADKSSAE